MAGQNYLLLSPPVLYFGTILQLYEDQNLLIRPSGLSECKALFLVYKTKI